MRRTAKSASLPDMARRAGLDATREDDLAKMAGVRSASSRSLLSCSEKVSEAPAWDQSRAPASVVVPPPQVVTGRHATSIALWLHGSFWIALQHVSASPTVAVAQPALVK